MRPLPVALLFLLTGCAPDPAELTVGIADSATATAQYFHGNCFAGFSVAVDLRIQETQRIGVVISKLAYRVTDRGTGQVLVDETLDTRVIDARYGERASSIPAGLTKVFRIGGVSQELAGPIAAEGEIDGIDENDQAVAESFALSAPLVVNEPGPPAGGACQTP